MNSAYSTISSVCSINADLDCEQIIDIILGRNQDKCSGSKIRDFSNITSDWDAREWKSVLKEYYFSFEKAKLPRITFQEQQGGISQEVAIDSQRELSSYKKAPNPYYLQMACFSVEMPSLGTPTNSVHEVLVSIYVALVMGENYATVGYPPQAFIDKVVGIPMSRQDFYATVVRMFESDKSFEKIVCEAAENDKQLVKRMKQSYKELCGITTTAKATKAATVAAVVATSASVKAGKAARKVKKAVYIPDEDEQKRKKKREPVGVDALNIKIFSKYGIIMLLINGAATPTKFWTGVNYIKVLAASETFLGMLGGSFVTILTCFIPLAGCITTVIMMFTGIVPGRSRTKRFSFFAMCIALLCTAYSVSTLISTALAALTAFLTKSLTPENIAKGATKGILGGIKGLGGGVIEFVGGLFGGGK